jgi:hypothetical protein
MDNMEIPADNCAPSRARLAGHGLYPRPASLRCQIRAAAVEPLAARSCGVPVATLLSLAAARRAARRVFIESGDIVMPAWKLAT